MPGVLDGLRVLDLSWGVAGPMTAMLMVDHGAEVTRIEPPGGDPFRNLLGYKVWQRGKRSATLDLKAPDDLKTFLALASRADVLIESFEPGVTERLGIDYVSLAAANPRLIYLSITPYGDDPKHAGRPGYDALVAARVGLQWEQRGWPEGAINHMVGREDPFADLEIDDDWVQGPPRPGPMFSASHWPSLGAFFLGSVGVSAALLAREATGRGQKVETSLMQGALASCSGGWQRMADPDAEGLNTWILGSRSPKGHFECSDGRWVHNWVPNPRFILQASQGDVLNATPDLTVQNDPDRFGIGPEEILVMAHYHPILAEAVKKFPCDDWVAAAAIAEVTMQEARAVETALADPLMLADGCVAEIDDPELGRIRQVGITYSLSSSPGVIPGPAPSPGQHTEAVKAEAAAIAGSAPRSGTAVKAAGDPPLKGIRVLDLGLAIAGPFGAQQLADLGAEVIKINAIYDTYWHKTHIAYMANRGKRSVALNLKDPRAKQILLDLVKTADVVQHNMRYDAAERLGVDYESLKAIKPDLIYCHTRGHEHGPREGLPANDQTGACLAGVQHEDGGMANGGKPMWSLTSFGDTGNGYLSTVGILQALYHRRKTGEGSFVDTAIVNACLLNTSHAVATPDGGAFERPRLDAAQTGFNAGCRLYETGDGWICVVASTEAHWDGLLTTLGVAELAARYPDAAARRAGDADIAAALAKAFLGQSAEHWSAALDLAGVPAEVSSAVFSRGVFDDEHLKARQWVVSYDHPLVGKLEQIGLLYSLSDTPGKIMGPPLVVGDQTEAVLRELGYDDAQIDTMVGERAIMVWPPRTGQAEVKSPWDAGPAKIAPATQPAEG
jgi:crotonobetainyl-CoA:carnitine CoA-transferase CaiB-like acyl-CoA transferase